MLNRIPMATLIATALLLPSLSAQASGQTGGFVVRLGNDTMQVERFVRTPTRLDGVVVTHAPQAKVMRYSLTFAADGSPAQYEMATSLPDGTPLLGDGQAGSIVFAADSLTREVLKGGQRLRERMPARPGNLPAPSLPYLGVSVLMYELGFAQARNAADAKGESALPQVYMIPGMVQPSRTRIWFIGSDSVEMDYFGVARRGFRLNGKGEILRSDWSGSTYKYAMTRVNGIDVEKIAKAWAQTEASVGKMGAVSPADTMRASVGAATITVTYSRPSKRGRVIWGTLVPWDAVWRFGADFATHLTTSANLVIGGTTLPAGRYTLWMLPSRNGTSQLIVNRQVNIFGTAYNPANDLVRIPLQRQGGQPVTERFTLEVQGGKLLVRWDDVLWWVTMNDEG